MEIRGDRINRKARICTEEIEDISTTDPMVILMDNVSDSMSHNLILRNATYNIIRTRTVLPLQNTKTDYRETKNQRMLQLPRFQGIMPDSV